MTVVPEDGGSFNSTSIRSQQPFDNEPSSLQSEQRQLLQRQTIYEIMMMTSKSNPNYVSSPVQPDFYSYEKALAASPTAVDNVSTTPHIKSRNKLTYLPYHLPWTPLAGPAEAPVDFNWVTESCGAKAAIGVFGGGVMGLLMGVFLGAMSDLTPPVSMIQGGRYLRPL